MGREIRMLGSVACATLSTQAGARVASELDVEIEANEHSIGDVGPHRVVVEGMSPFPLLPNARVEVVLRFIEG